MKYRKRFLDLAFETGIISRRGEEKRLFLDPFFQGNAHALELAAKACREAMQGPHQLAISSAGTLVAFDDSTYPLLPVAAQSFRGGDCRSFAHYSTYHRFKFSEGRPPNHQQCVVVGTFEDGFEPQAAIDFVNKFFGECVGVVVLYSRTTSQVMNTDLSVPIIRVVTEEDAIRYLDAHLNEKGDFVRHERVSTLD